MSDLQLQITSQNSQCCIILLSGPIDSENSEILDKYIENIENSTKHIILNFSQVISINSTGLGTLVKIADRIGKRRFLLTCLPPEIFELIDMLGLTSIFSIFDDENAAKNYTNKPD